MVEDGKNGYILKKNSAAELASVLLKLVDNKDTRKKMGSRSAQKALGMGWKSVGERLQQYF